ncbi:MAG: HD domain-containing protein [Gemmataceae bacterium]
MSSSDPRRFWRDAWGDAAFDDLLARHAEPHRHYHTLTHVLAVLEALPGAGTTLAVAAWYHDAVYDPRAADNEERSAGLMRRSLMMLPPDVLDEAARLIRLTKTHQAADDDADGMALLDADLAILGADVADYDAYAAAIRREYAWVPEADYREGRTAVLRRFLGRGRIYHTARMSGREGAARANLEREIEKWAGAGGGG